MVKFNGIELLVDIYLAAKAPTLTLFFTDATGAPTFLFTGIEAILNASATDWIDVVLRTETVKGWLDTEIGQTGFTGGEVLTSIKLLWK